MGTGLTPSQRPRRGILTDPSEGANAAALSLLATGKATTDLLRIGLDVTADCAVVDTSGRPSGRLHAVGPLTRGAFLKIDAVPDIRLQWRKLARLLSGSMKEGATKTEALSRS